MKINLAIWDRAFRFFFGVLLSAWAVAGGPIWAYFGTYFVLTASWGWCPLYSYFKFRTARIKEKRFIP